MGNMHADFFYDFRKDFKPVFADYFPTPEEIREARVFGLKLGHLYVEFFRDDLARMLNVLRLKLSEKEIEKLTTVGYVNDLRLFFW